MKAVVKLKRDYGNIGLVDVEKPTAPKGKEILIRVKSAAICGSDVHSYEYIESSHFIKVPVIMGHEFSGVVEAVGPEVKEFSVGDKIMAESNVSCGYCKNCHKGKTNVCDHSYMRGLTIDGTMAEYVKVEERCAHKVDEKTKFSSAAIAQPCSVVIHGVFDNCNITPGDSVVVFGPGIMGNVAAQLAQIKGAGKVFIVGTDADAALRLPAAKDLGLIPINSQKEDVKKVIYQETGREEVDVCIECSGAEPALQEAISLIRKNGELTILGIYPRDVKIDLTGLIRKEVNVHTSYTSAWEHYELALSLINQGKICLDSLYTEYPCEEAEKAFQDAVNKDVIKPVLIF